MPPMIETTGFLLGFGFSVLVYVRSIRTADLSWRKKAAYSLFTFIGITGTVFLGILIADRLRRWGRPLFPVVAAYIISTFRDHSKQKNVPGSVASFPYAQNKLQTIYLSHLYS
jgi:hypothetical protein